MLQRVTDPALMAQLEGGEAPESAPAAAPSGALPKGYSLRPPPAKPQPKTSYTPMSADDKKKYGLDVRFPYFMSSEGKPDLPEGFKPESVEGKPVSEWAAKRFTIPRDQYEPLANATDSFQDDFGGNTLTGSLESQVQALFSDVGTPGQRDWWSNFYQTDMAIRHGLYGSALTPVEKKSYDQATVTPNMDPKEI